MKKQTPLIKLVSVGKATVQDFDRIGIHYAEDLVGKDAGKLVKKLEKIHGRKLDPCCEDVFRAAIAQAENPDLPEDQKQWWYWSRIRKAGDPK